MPDIVIDSSAMIEVVAGHRPDARLRKRVLLGRLTAPELFDIEAMSVLRKRARAGDISELDATALLADIRETPVARAPHLPLLNRVWELRHSVSPYDAAYVALAEHLGVPLVTCDEKLAGSHGHDAEIELYPVS